MVQVVGYNLCFNYKKFVGDAEQVKFVSRTKELSMFWKW